MFTEKSLLEQTPRLRKFAWRLTRNSFDADDLVQSTCLRALEKSDSFLEGTNLFSWTSKIMFNLFVSRYRHKAKFETQIDPETYLDNQYVLPMQDISAELLNVRRAMLSLSPDHSRILVLICVEGMRYDEVSKMLDVPVGTVRSRLSRARGQLQMLLAAPSSVPIHLKPSKIRA